MVLGEEDVEGDAPSSRDALKEEIKYHHLEGKWIDGLNGCGLPLDYKFWFGTRSHEHHKHVPAFGDHEHDVQDPP